ncbi:hypothetical protein LINPERPRIM_LOCUS25557 [Linum perenne]
MGVCFSFSASSPPPPPTAKLISLTGDLHHYPPFISVTQVLTKETTSDASSSNDFFICNSDFLSYDDPIPALRYDTMLLPNQLYFLLPISMLNSTLTVPQMASLAVTASHALQISSPTTKSTISPLLFPDHHLPSSSSMLKLKEPAARQIRRSGSIKKLQRYASRRAKLAVGSFKLRMATIYEGTVL